MNCKKLILMTLAVATMSLQSCLSDNAGDVPRLYANAVVTVKHMGKTHSFFQLDAKTTLYPVNVNSILYNGKEVRALINYTKVDSSAHGFSKAVVVNGIDSIRTKDIVQLAPGQRIETLGNDPIEIVDDWVTISEDGYLTLRVRAIWGNLGHKHRLNLVAGINPNNPHEVELRHDAGGDRRGVPLDALIAFRLYKYFPVEGAKDYKLTVKWKGFNGKMKEATFTITAPATLPFNSVDKKLLHTGARIN